MNGLKGGAGQQAGFFGVFWPILPKMENILSEDSSERTDRVSEESVVGSKVNRVESDHPTTRKGAVTLSSPAHRGGSGSRERAHFLSGRGASPPEFSKNAIGINLHAQNISHPFPKCPGMGSNI